MAYTGSSIVDYLKSLNKDSSYTARSRLAEQLGIQGYKGTAEQNLKMLGMLRSQATAQPAAPAATPAATPTVNTSAITLEEKKPTGTSDLDRELAKKIASGELSYEDSLKQFAQTGGQLTPSQKQLISSPAITALESVSPTRQKVNELVDRLLGTLNTTPYNPETDTSFQAAKGELEKTGKRAYGDVMAGYLGTQGGNVNTAAQQIASTALNELLGQIPLLQQQYEDRYTTKQRQQLSDTTSTVNMLLGLEDRDIAMQDRELQRQLDTIGQYYSDFQAEINRREAINPNDPLIPYLKAARQEKILAQEAAQQAAEEKAAEAKTKEEQRLFMNALELWSQLTEGATPEIAAILGVAPGARAADYDLKRISAAIAQKQADTSAFSAQTARKRFEWEKEQAEKKDKEKPVFDADDYYKDALAMKNEMIEVPDPDKPLETIKQPKYTKYNIIHYVMSSPLDTSKVNEILTRLRYSNRDIQDYIEYMNRRGYMGEFKQSDE